MICVLCVAPVAGIISVKIHGTLRFAKFGDDAKFKEWSDAHPFSSDDFFLAPTDYKSSQRYARVRAIAKLLHEKLSFCIPQQIMKAF